ncbi:putative 60s ribosomal protein l36 [Diaporthe ampelina]|uniref:Putative 60s ribosomal protein l36 n=1 Tax=Diaporthe ampelina TaxID=1214573 RepID=A0A0G2FS31_9PEZI|nr:putative 60s ribosomal protein l36 [Diaporthe ampelina]
MILIGLQWVWGIACIILLNMQCRPHEAIWKFYLESTCYSLPSVMLTSASVQVFTDISMVLLPQRVIWSLQMSWRRKVGISVVFGVGLLACIAAVVRLKTTVDFAKTEDQMYYIGPLLFWACAEMTCGFFILCVPCLPKIVSESSCCRRVKRALGISTGKLSTSGQKSSNFDSKFGGSYGSRKKSRSADMLNTTTGASAYYQMDDDAVGLDTLKTSESTENLRKSVHGGGGVHVTKTVVVTNLPYAHSDNDSNGETGLERPRG